MSRKIVYEFKFEDDTSWNYEIDFDDENLFIPREVREVKKWTLLEFHKCPNCPLKEGAATQCPVARNLDQVVEDSKDTISCLQAQVDVQTEERVYSKNCATQEGLRSLFGVIMATSGCPHLDWLRPLARYHLPFADVDETLFRVLSLQLLYQYFNERESNLSSSAAKIQSNYDSVQIVNHKFIERIRSYCDADADKNAMVALDVYAQMFLYQRQSDFGTLKKYFATSD